MTTSPLLSNVTDQW